MLSRVRQCTWCKANIRGYDHHCPAFGTCIGIVIFHFSSDSVLPYCGMAVVGMHSNLLCNFAGQKNHRLFMALLTGFVVAESTYTMCSTKCMLFVFLLSEMSVGFYPKFLIADVAVSYLFN